MGLIEVVLKHASGHRGCFHTAPKPPQSVKGILNLNEINDFLSILQSLLNTSAESIENNNKFLLLNND